MRAKNSKENLCDSCKLFVETCPIDLTIKYGDSVGGDNVIKCDYYRSETTDSDGGTIFNINGECFPGYDQ